MDRRPTILRLALLIVFVALLASCGGPPLPESDTDSPARDDHLRAARGETWPGPETCELLPGDPVRGGTLVLALGQAVAAAHAPVPTNDAERTVFANLYETLVAVRCDGELEPGLAVSWQRLEDGRRWRLRLRAGAVFWDGTPVTAAAVMAAWSRNETLARATGRPCPGLWIAAGSRGLAVRGDRELEIRLAEPQDDLPRLLAHPSLAVALPREGWLWPVGSGPCRLAADTGRPLPDLLCRPNLHHPRAPRWREFVFRVRPGNDPRDLLTAGVDLAVIRDRRAADYYAALEGVRSAPLPWDRLYVMLVPPASSLAAPAVAAAASGAVAPAESRPWDRLDFHGCAPRACPQLHGPTVGIATPPLDPDPALLAMETARIYHPAGDPDARALAERGAAFAGETLDLRGAGPEDLARALQNGEAAAFVLVLDACYPTACLTLSYLTAHADWLQQELDDEMDACAAARILAARGRAIPLVQTRPRLVWRSPLAGLALAHDGALLVAGLGRAAPEVAP